MSSQEKRFIVVSPSHHKKPRTMFLSKTNSGRNIWCDFVPGITTLWLLSEAQEFAANSPVAIWFIEDKDWISSLDTGDMPKFADILKYAQKAESEIIRYKPQDMIPPIVMLPRGERDDDADYIYLFYTLTADNQITYYRSENPRQTIRREKQLAEVFTKAEAQAKTMFPDEDGCMWHAEKVNKVIAKEAEEANKNVIDGLKQTFGDNPKLVTLPKEEQPEANEQYIVVYFQPISTVGRVLFTLFLPLNSENNSMSLCQPTHDNQPCYDCQNANFFTDKNDALDFAQKIGFFVYKITDKQKELIEFLYRMSRDFGDPYPTIEQAVFLYIVGEDSLVEPQKKRQAD